MKLRSIFALSFQMLSALAYSQELKQVEVYTYERTINTDSLATDTIISRIEYYDTTGLKYRVTSFLEGFLFQEVIWEGDSVRHMRVPGGGDNWRNIEYRYDKNGQVNAIIEANDTSIYKNEYNDTLIIRSICLSGCDYIDHYYYNENKQLVRFSRESPTGYSYSWELGYDELGRIVRSISDNLITVHKYQEHPKVEIQTDYLSDDKKEMEKAITYYDDLGRVTRTEHFLQPRFCSRLRGFA